MVVENGSLLDRSVKWTIALFQVQLVNGDHRLKFTGGVFSGFFFRLVVGFYRQKRQIQLPGVESFKKILRSRRLHLSQPNLPGKHR